MYLLQINVLNILLVSLVMLLLKDHFLNDLCIFRSRHVSLVLNHYNYVMNNPSLWPSFKIVQKVFSSQFFTAVSLEFLQIFIILYITCRYWCILIPWFKSNFSDWIRLFFFTCSFSFIFLFFLIFFIFQTFFYLFCFILLYCSCILL